ncbi:hypothetical protein [Polymorphobacter sp.]|uniref:hypothetical protein n=1 Tax=Polymorphobacter sp. TaxID=1909290 RepID=UPI003F7136F9
MSVEKTLPRATGDAGVADRTLHEILILAYPDIDETELELVIGLIARPTHEEFIWLYSGDVLRSKVKQIRADHPARFINRQREMIIIAALVLAVFASCWLLWDIGLR